MEVFLLLLHTLCNNFLLNGIEVGFSRQIGPNREVLGNNSYARIFFQCILKTYISSKFLYLMGTRVGQGNKPSSTQVVRKHLLNFVTSYLIETGSVPCFLHNGPTHADSDHVYLVLSSCRPFASSSSRKQFFFFFKFRTSFFFLVQSDLKRQFFTQSCQKWNCRHILSLCADLYNVAVGQST